MTKQGAAMKYILLNFSSITSLRLRVSAVNRNLVVLGALGCLPGCSQFSQVQLDLLQQSRKGIELTQKSLEEKSQFINAYHAVQRKRIDEAFDEDVRNRADLDADWVIEHRRAYAAALDAIASARAASIDADRVTKENLSAMDQALQRIIWLQTAQLNLTNFFKEPKP
jgi:hypothetical protein